MYSLKYVFFICFVVKSRHIFPVGPCRYQTGALAPLVRWLSQGMQRAAAPPQPPRPAVRADNVPGAGRQGNDNVAAGGTSFQLMSINR